MNTCRDKAKFRNFRILLDRFSSTILMIRIITKLTTTKYDPMQWQNQVDNITTNLKVKMYFTLPEFSVTKQLM